MQRTWQKDQARYYAYRHHCRSGPVYAGRVSTFSGGNTADGIHVATEPGIALRREARAEWFRLRTSNGVDLVQQIDYGPATWTGRVIDITEAEASILGGVVTDTWGEAKLIPGNCL